MVKHLWFSIWSNLSLSCNFVSVLKSINHRNSNSLQHFFFCYPLYKKLRLLKLTLNSTIQFSKSLLILSFINIDFLHYLFMKSAGISTIRQQENRSKIVWFSFFLNEFLRKLIKIFISNWLHIHFITISIHYNDNI